MLEGVKFDHLALASVFEDATNLFIPYYRQAGMRYADRMGYRFAVQFDGDGQHRAEYIAPMRKKIGEDGGYDIVIASRFVTEKKPATLRMLGSRIIAGAIRLSSGITVQDPTSGMRMYSRRMIELFSRHVNYPPEPDSLSIDALPALSGEADLALNDALDL